MLAKGLPFEIEFKQILKIQQGIASKIMGVNSKELFSDKKS